jgi:hypothetical protein
LRTLASFLSASHVYSTTPRTVASDPYLAITWACPGRRPEDPARPPPPPGDARSRSAGTSGIAGSPTRASFTVRGSKASDKPPVRARLQNAASAAAPPSIAAGKQIIEWFVGSLAETQRCTIRQTPGNPRPPILLTDVRLAQMSR